MKAYQVVQYEKQINKEQLSLPNPLKNKTEKEQMASVTMKGRNTMKEESQKFLKDDK